MDWIKAIGFGVLIWVLMFAIVSAVLNTYQETLWMKILIILVAGLIAWFLAKKVKPSSMGSALGYGFVWVVVGLILDYFVTMRFNTEIFQLWSLWAGYGLIFIAPFLRIKGK